MCFCGPKRTKARVTPGTAALAMAAHRRPCAATRSTHDITAGREEVMSQTSFFVGEVAPARFVKARARREKQQDLPRMTGGGTTRRT